MRESSYYRKIAEGLKPEIRSFINGKFVEGSGPAFDTVNPAHGKVIARIRAGPANPPGRERRSCSA